MSTLKFPSAALYSSPTEYFEFERKDEPGSPIAFVAEVTRTLQDRARLGDSRVYLTTLTSSDGSKHHDIVLKLAYGNRALRRYKAEADFYRNELKDLQGECVPRFRGLYEGDTREGRTAVLLLDFHGDPPETDLRFMKSAEKVAVIDALMAIHRAGVKHRDFQKTNIVLSKEGKVFIIDFSHAEKHECGLSMAITENEKEPLEEEVGCEEIFYACTMSNFWTPRIPRSPEKLAAIRTNFEKKYSRELLASYSPEGVDDEVALRVAARSIENFQEMLEQRRYRETKGMKVSPLEGPAERLCITEDQ